MLEVLGNRSWFCLSRELFGSGLVDWPSFFKLFDHEIYLECLSLGLGLISILLINLIMGHVQRLIFDRLIQIKRIFILFWSIFRVAVETVLAIFGNWVYCSYAVPFALTVVDRNWLALRAIVSEKTFMITIGVSVLFSSCVWTRGLEAFTLLGGNHYMV